MMITVRVSPDEFDAIKVAYWLWVARKVEKGAKMGKSETSFNEWAKAALLKAAKSHGR